MTRPFIFLAMMIPLNPGKKLDVFLRPMIDKLNNLLFIGIETYDIFRKGSF